MTQNMGVRPDGTMSPCNAKDPNNCRYHKKGSHAPMNQKKMMDWNEKVVAKASKSTQHALSKKSSSHQVTSHPVDGSILKADTLNDNDLQFITRVGRQAASYMMASEKWGDGDVYSHTDFKVRDYSSKDKDKANKLIDYAVRDKDRAWADNMYNRLQNGTIMNNLDVSPDDSHRDVIRKGFKYLVTDPKFSQYMKGFQEEFIVHAENPENEKTESHYSSGSLSGTKRILASIS